MLSQRIKTGSTPKRMRTHRKLQERTEKYNRKLRKWYIEITLEKNRYARITESSEKEQSRFI